MNNRSTFIALRSTTTVTNRPAMVPSSAPTPRMHQTVPSATNVTTATTTATAAAAGTTITTTTIANHDDKIRQNSAKSVFPLFFDVL